MRLRLHPCNITSPVITTKKGKADVIFKREEYMVKFVDRCKFTVVGKFQHTMPKMETIRRSFIAKRWGLKLPTSMERQFTLILTISMIILLSGPNNTCTFRVN